MRLIAATIAFGLVGLTGYQAFGPTKPVAPEPARKDVPTASTKAAAAGRALLRSCLLAERAAAWACEAQGTGQKLRLERAAGAADAAADYLSSQSPLSAEQTSVVAHQLTELAIELRAAEAKPGNFKKLQPQLEELNKIASLLADAEAKLWDEHQAELARTPAAVAEPAQSQTGQTRQVTLLSFALSCAMFAFVFASRRERKAVSDYWRARNKYEIAVVESETGRIVISSAKR